MRPDIRERSTLRLDTRSVCKRGGVHIRSATPVKYPSLEWLDFPLERTLSGYSLSATQVCVGGSSNIFLIAHNTRSSPSVLRSELVQNPFVQCGEPVSLCKRRHSQHHRYETRCHRQRRAEPSLQDSEIRTLFLLIQSSRFLRQEQSPFSRHNKGEIPAG